MIGGRFDVVVVFNRRIFEFYRLFVLFRGATDYFLYYGADVVVVLWAVFGYCYRGFRLVLALWKRDFFYLFYEAKCYYFSKLVTKVLKNI